MAMLVSRRVSRQRASVQSERQMQPEREKVSERCGAGETKDIQGVQQVEGETRRQGAKGVLAYRGTDRITVTGPVKPKLYTCTYNK